MGTPFIGEIRMFAGNFAPAGWELCAGQLLSISENDALFTLIGTTYGGDGQSTFALPDLRGRAPIHQGQSPGLSNYVIGQAAGVETVTLGINQIPNHTHGLLANGALAGRIPNPTNAVFTSVGRFYSVSGTNAAQPPPLTTVGGSAAHTNMQPYLAINYIISLFGIFPSSS